MAKIKIKTRAEELLEKALKERKLKTPSSSLKINHRKPIKKEKK